MLETLTKGFRTAREPLPGRGRASSDANIADSPSSDVRRGPSWRPTSTSAIVRELSWRKCRSAWVGERGPDRGRQRRAAQKAARQPPAITSRKALLRGADRADGRGPADRAGQGPDPRRPDAPGPAGHREDLDRGRSWPGNLKEAGAIVPLLVAGPTCARPAAARARRGPAHVGRDEQGDDRPCFLRLPGQLRRGRGLPGALQAPGASARGSGPWPASNRLALAHQRESAPRSRPS